jgi:hypothetical protein
VDLESRYGIFSGSALRTAAITSRNKGALGAELLGARSDSDKDVITLRRRATSRSGVVRFGDLGARHPHDQSKPIPTRFRAVAQQRLHSADRSVRGLHGGRTCQLDRRQGDSVSRIPDPVVFPTEMGGNLRRPP